MGTKTLLGADELHAHLNEQLGFIERSAEAFDSGHEDDAKRLAVTIRVLFHDTGKSHSLLQKLGMKGQRFINTALPFDPNNPLSHSGLIAMHMSGNGCRYVPHLDGGPPVARTSSFDDWWEEPVFVDGERRRLTRKNLILTAANQDGGAHVDSELDDGYAALSRRNSLNQYSLSPAGAQPIAAPERAAIRQIAHEVLKTLRPGYSKQSNLEGLVLAGMRLNVVPGSPPPASAPIKMGRNERCYCGSGKKFKHCHGSWR